MCERPQFGVGGMHPLSLLPASPASLDGRVSCFHLRCATCSIMAYGYRNCNNCWNDGIWGTVPSSHLSCYVGGTHSIRYAHSCAINPTRRQFHEKVIVFHIPLVRRCSGGVQRVRSCSYACSSHRYTFPNTTYPNTTYIHTRTNFNSNTYPIANPISWVGCFTS